MRASLWLSFVGLVAVACAASSSSPDDDGTGETSTGGSSSGGKGGASHAAGKAATGGDPGDDSSAGDDQPSGDDQPAGDDQPGGDDQSAGGSPGTGDDGGAAGGIDVGAGGSSLDGNPNCPAGVQAIVYAHGPNALYAIDPGTLNLTTVGTFENCGEEMIDIAVDATGNIYGTTFTSFVRIDPTDASCTVLKSGSEGEFPNSLSFVPKGTVDPNVEALVGYNGSDYLRLDTTTGAITKIGGLSNGKSSSGDIVSVIGGGTYLTVTSDGDDELIQVDPATGDQIKSIGSTKHTDVFGLAYWGGIAFGFTDGGDGFTMDVTTGAVTNIVNGSNYEFYGAGSTTCARIGMVH